MHQHQRTTCVLASILFASTAAHANLITIPAGTDYYQTSGDAFGHVAHGAFLQLDGAPRPANITGAPIGGHFFEGVPVDPVNLGATDTVIRRLSDATITTPAGSDRIPIEVQALSLRNVSPIEITRQVANPNPFENPLETALYNVFVELDSSQPAFGEMSFIQEDSSGRVTLREVDTRYSISLQATFTEISGGGQNDFVTHFDWTFSAQRSCWSPDGVGDPNPLGGLSLRCFGHSMAFIRSYYDVDSYHWFTPTGTLTASAPVPAPPTLYLLLAALPALLNARKNATGPSASSISPGQNGFFASPRP